MKRFVYSACLALALSLSAAARPVKIPPPPLEALNYTLLFNIWF